MGGPELRDGKEFTMPVPAANAGSVCVVAPVAARDPAACEGLALDGIPIDTLASMALVRMSDDFVTVALKLSPARNQAAFETSSAPAFTKGFLDAARTEMRAPLKIVETSVQSSTLVSTQGVRVLRIRYDVSGVDPQGPTARVAHQNAFVVPVENGLYVLTWMSTADDAAALDAMAEQAAIAIHVDRPAPSRDFLRGELVGKAIGSSLPVVMGIIAFVVYHVHRRRAARAAVAVPAAPPQWPPPG